MDIHTPSSTERATPNRQVVRCRVNASSICDQAERILMTRRLIKLGAKVALVIRLTQLEKSTANRLYREIRGSSSPSGPSCYSGNWFQRKIHRMLEATFVWQLYGKLLHAEISEPERLITIYNIYTLYFETPELTINHLSDVIRLMSADVWQYQKCTSCSAWYLAKKGDIKNICPGCKLRALHHCSSCGTVIEQNPAGPRRHQCHTCRSLEKSRSTGKKHHL